MLHKGGSGQNETTVENEEYTRKLRHDTPTHLYHDPNN